MAELNDDYELYNTIVHVLHDFEVDLNCVVVANHRFVLEGINRAEDEEIKQLQEQFAQEDSETLSSAVNHIVWEYEELRNAANQLALVGVVTRLQHWIAGFVEKLPTKPSKRAKVSDSWLINNLALLDRSLGYGPVPTAFFEDVVNVRNSIIHADSQAKWTHHGQRVVAARYRNSLGKVELSETQLREAIEKSIRQVSWYDEKLHL